MQTEMFCVFLEVQSFIHELLALSEAWCKEGEGLLMPQVSAHYSSPTACQAGCRVCHSDCWLVFSCTAASLLELACSLFLQHLLGQWESQAQRKTVSLVV